jgi:hypothetical protein
MNYDFDAWALNKFNVTLPLLVYEVLKLIEP